MEEKGGDSAQVHSAELPGRHGCAILPLGQGGESGWDCGELSTGVSDSLCL